MNEMVFAYTRKRAIADGALIDVTERAKEAGMLLPVGLTRGVWAECVAVPGGLEGQDEAGCLWHVLRTCYRAICRNREVGPQVLFRLRVTNDNRPEGPTPVTLQVVLGPDDDGRPCLTIKLPAENYPAKRVMAFCRHCHQDMADPETVTCPANVEVAYPDGTRLPSSPGHFREPGGRCRGCGIRHGGQHHPGCAAERCPRCTRQLTSCGCL